MKKPQRRGPAPSTPVGTLVARATESLRHERFKEAIELFKLAIRQDPRPEWRASLAEAYHGRARGLAAKKMFKEAAMVLENTIAPDGTVRDSRLYVTCLLRDGQQPKAAAYLLRCVSSETALPVAERAGFEELTAALLLAIPQLPPPAGGTPAAAATRWRELATASRAAITAWVDGASAEVMDGLLSRISLRSAFRPVRLILKSLTATPHDAERTRQLLDTIQPASPFHPFRQAVEVAVQTDRALDADGWNRLSPAQQAFVAETNGLPPAATQFLERTAKTARDGPAVLIGYLLQRTDLPLADVRSACLNLLPQVPDRIPQFEKRFGRLSALERARVKALSAEARGDWEAAEREWLNAADSFEHPGADRQARLSQGVIFRHLARLAERHPEMLGGDDSEDPEIYFLERSRQVDPEHIPTLMALIDAYRKEPEPKDWYRLVDEAVQRFPADSQVLLAATEAAVARKSYKKAAGFARRLLEINPINPGVRRQMIELQVAHARKQMRSKRPDLAAKELAGAAEWERADAPSALLRIARGLIALQTGPAEQAEAWLREGVDLAGGGVAGWFLVCLEAELMKCAGDDAERLRHGLAHAAETPPTREAVMAIVAALGKPDAGENRRPLAGMLQRLRPWLAQAAAIAWSPAEFQTLAETFTRFEAFDLMQAYVEAGQRRDPANPAWRFHAIVARTRNNGLAVTIAETEDLLEMATAAAQRQDFHAANRIERFLSGDGASRFRRRRSAPPDLPDDLDDEDITDMIEAMIGGMPKGAADNLRSLAVEFGRDGAAAQMYEQLRDSPLGEGIPDPLLRELCKAMLAKALAGGRPKQRETAQRSLF